MARAAWRQRVKQTKRQRVTTRDPKLSNGGSTSRTPIEYSAMAVWFLVSTICGVDL